MNGLAAAAIITGGAVLATALIIGMIVGMMALLGPLAGGLTAIGIVIVGLFLLTWWRFS